MNLTLDSFKGMKVTIMGLGLHGGGLACTRFLASRGADITVTDLRKESELSPTIKKLEGIPLRFVLGRHEHEDFSSADLVIKNPAVPGNSPFLKSAVNIETDISLFLRFNRQPVIAITGSKGKSTVTSALYKIVAEKFPQAKLGGNITVSPLTFLDDCLSYVPDPVILELSSWQLADLKDKKVLRPEIAAITNILPDHQNYYGGMEPYVQDKSLIFRDQDPSGYTLVPFDDAYGCRFADETPGIPLYFSSRPLHPGTNGAFLANREGFFSFRGEVSKILPDILSLPGEHNRMNLLLASAISALYCSLTGIDRQFIPAAVSGFTGIEHRLELAAVKKGVRWYNDSAATIPQAVSASIVGFLDPLHLISGGTDKELDFSGFPETLKRVKYLYLLEGSATARLIPLLQQQNISFYGPYSNLKEAVYAAARNAQADDIVLFSPGSTSFGMFQNEFDRGRKFKSLVKELPD